MKKENIIFIIVTLVIIAGCIILGVCLNKHYELDNNVKDSNLLSGKHYVMISVKDYGDIKLELDADVAPITVTNFINLVKDEFYNGLTFHRIMDGFMIQGGGYDEDGYRKEASSIKGEFAANGVKNNISHKRGVISMARANDMNSASSEFFIVHDDSEFLDGNYAAFGYVVSGLDVVDKIAKKAKPTDDNGSIKLDERPIIESIILVED